MTIRENVSLKELTTFKVGGTARFVVTCESVEDVSQALLFAKEKECPWYVLGEGSNMIPSDEGFPGVILLMRDTTLLFEEKGDAVMITCGAGVVFDALVSEACERGLWGLENLAGIPGTVGAAPVQNIGAYGSEIAQVLSSVEVFDTKTKEYIRMSKEECEFSYRESLFKKRPEYIIVRVILTLSTDGAPNISYPDLLTAQEQGAILTTPSTIADTVRAIRAKKFPDWTVEGTAGSFFKNPIISAALYDNLSAQYGEIPRYPAGDAIKIPLAFILDKVLGLKGYVKGKARLFERQPLVLVTEPGATAHDIESLAQEIEERVKESTSIEIEREPRTFENTF